MAKISILFKIFAITIVVLIGFGLRYRHAVEVPVAGISMDEYSYTWVGLSLIKDHYPIGISIIPGYEKKERKYVNPDNILNTAVSGPLTLSHPWFDHPPALGLLTGGYSFLKGARTFEDIHVGVARKPMIVLGTLSVILVFLLAMQYFGFLAGFISALIYASAPVSVVGSRMIQGENGIIPIILMSLLLLGRYLKNQKIQWLVITGLLVGTGMLFKISGIAGLLIGLILVIATGRKEYRIYDSLILLATSLSVVLLFAVYGYYFDWHIFKNIFLSNSTRFYGMGPEAIINLLIKQKLTANIGLPDGWIIVGWISFLIVAGKKQFKNKIWILAPVLGYLVVYIFFGSYSYGWYAFPFYPFLAIASGYVLKQIYVKAKMLLGFMMTIIPIGTILSGLINISDFQKWANVWRLGLSGIIMLLVLNEYTKIPVFIKKIILSTTFLLAILLNILFIDKLNFDYWYKIVW